MKVTKAYTLGNLAKECHCKVWDLQKPLEHITDFAYDQLVLTITESITQKTMSRILKTIKEGSAEEKRNCDIGPELYGFLLEQYKSSKELVSISQLAEENHFNKRIVHNILNKWKKFNWQLIHKNFVSNIFKSTSHYYVSTKKKNVVAQLLLAQMAVESTLQSGWVDTSDIALPTRSNSIQVNLLEQVQDVNSTKGRVIAFGERDDHKIVPIVRWYNGSISFAPVLQHSPRTSSNLNYRPLKHNKRTCSFIIPIQDVCDQKKGKRKIQIFNALLRMLEGKSVEISISLKSLLEPLNSSTSNSGRIYLRMNPTRINLDDLDLNDETQNARLEKAKAYGKNGVTNQEMLEFLKKYTDENTKTNVSLTKSKSNPLLIYSSSYRVVIYLPGRPSYSLLEQRAKEAHQTVGEYMKTLSDINEAELQLSVFQADHRQMQIRAQEKLAQQVGKHVLAKYNLSLEEAKDNKAFVRNYLIKNGIKKEISDIILEDPLTVKNIANKLK